MKGTTFAGYVLSIFLLLISVEKLANNHIVLGILIFLIAFSVSPLSSMLLMKYGVYKSQNRFLIKAISALIFFVIALPFNTDKTLTEEETTNSLSNEDTKADNVVTETEPVRYTPVIDTDKLKPLQKKWADSTVKDWKGAYIKRYSLSLSLDTIYFQLSKEGTKGHWQETAHANESAFQEDYNNVIARKSGNEFSSVKTLIVLVPDEQQQAENEEKAQRKRLINRQFSAWDGANPFLENYIKQNMNDPGSYEHIETTYTDKGSYILVYTTFRGKNAFGAKVINHVKAKMDLEGNVLSMVSQD